MYYISFSQSNYHRHIRYFLKTLAIWVLMTISLFGGKTNDLINDWNEIAEQVMIKFPTPPRGPLQDMAYVHIAIFDALNAIDGEYYGFAVELDQTFPGANKSNAVAAAVRIVLKTLYPAGSAFIDSVYNSRVSLEPTKRNLEGIEVGEKVAALFMKSREGDGSTNIVPYIWQTPGLGVYQTTPPGSAQYQTIGTTSSQMRPFSFSSPSKFRAPAPPDFTSSTYANDLNEVKKYGSLDSSFTTPEQREIARFHTENPAVFTVRNARNIIKSKGLSMERSARLYAQIWAAIADALITGFETKYYYNYWRPVTAIRQADIDGNPNTEADPLWQPLVPTPRHPEYPAAHGCGQGAMAYTFEYFFGTTKIPVTLNSTVTKTEHHFKTTTEWTEEISNARVYGGMHFRNSCEAGLEIGRKVSEWIAETKFRKKYGAKHLSKSSVVSDEVKQFTLEQNYPNPFNPATSIRFSIPSPEFVNLTVYNILGKEVAILVNEQKDAGNYNIEFNAVSLPSGIYMYKLKAGKFERFKKLILLK